MSFLKDFLKITSPAYAVTSFLGNQKKSAMSAADQAAAAQAEYTNAGYGKQREELGKGYTAADTILSGYEKPGQQAYSQYADSIGVNGLDGYGRAMTSFNADPFRAGTQDATQRAIQSMFRRYNPTGQTGQQMTAVGRIGADRYAGDVDAYRNRLMGFGTQGAQFGMQRATNSIGQGQEMGQSFLGQNNALANVETQRLGNRQAASNQFMDNIFKIGGTALGIATGGSGRSNPLMQGYGSGYMGPR